MQSLKWLRINPSWWCALAVTRSVICQNTAHENQYAKTVAVYTTRRSLASARFFAPRVRKMATWLSTLNVLVEHLPLPGKLHVSRKALHGRTALLDALAFAPMKQQRFLVKHQTI